MRNLRHYIAVSLFVAVASGHAGGNATTFHVSPLGSNTPPYSTLATAAHNPRDAVLVTSEPGDTVFIHSGSYDIDTTIDLPNGVILRGDGMDSTSLVYRGTLEKALLLHLLGQNELEGISFINPLWNGAPQTTAVLKTSPGPGDLTVTSCRFDMAGMFFTSSGAYNISQNEFIVNNGTGGISAGGGVANISENFFLGAGGVRQPGDAIHADGGDVVIDHNIFDYRTAGENGTSVRIDRFPARAVVRNNLILGGKYSIAWYFTDGVIENNTIVGALDTLDSFRIAQDEFDTLTIRNNALIDLAAVPNFFNRCPSCPPIGPIRMTHNVFWPSADSFHTYGRNVFGLDVVQPWQVQLLDSANFNAYPMFVDDSLFELQDGSPLIDAGDPALLDIDGSRSDIGWRGGPTGSAYTYIQLPPTAPDSIWVSGTNGLISVTWSARPEADLGEYRLYRGTTSGFWQPGLPPHRIISPNDTTFIDTIIVAGEGYHYVVTAVDTAGLEGEPSPEGQFVVSGVFDGDDEAMVPRTPGIERVYPNPFNAGATMTLRIPDVGSPTAQVRVELYDVTGRLASVAYSGPLGSGEASIQVMPTTASGETLASGVYFARLRVGSSYYGKPQKLVLLK